MTLDLPPIYLLSTHLQPEELHSLEEQIPSLTWNIQEAELVLGNITRRERALFELRRLKLQTREISSLELSHSDTTFDSPHRRSDSGDGGPSPKRRKTSLGDGSRKATNVVKVLKLSWLTKSLEEGVVLPTQDYLLYVGKKSSPTETLGHHDHKKDKTPPPGSVAKHGITQNTPVLLSSPSTTSSSRRDDHRHRRNRPQPPALVHESTSEHDIRLPLVPSYLQTSYSCQRPTPVYSPNAGFIEALKEVRTLRILEGDQVGVRAYSTSIASLSAYPFALQTSGEVARLPGCGAKIAELYHQWGESGKLNEITQASLDERLTVLGLFYNIWGVGDTTAREFYNKGWRDLDDLVEHGWGQLSRVQQIGVKYYDQFLLKIPRNEVESIGETIMSHSLRIDAGFQMTIVGGYRRGKANSGDVDVIVSHPDEAMTNHLVDRLVIALEKSHYVTHTLALSLKNSERGQAPLPWRGEGNRGSGFDTLDKALVVWKDPHDESALHRRVDIIVSPWRTAGCAVLGWSGGTTFQRDLRRYCKREKGLKFDSSGIRSRANGTWVDFEGSGTAPDMETAEKRVFEGLGLTWRRPEERCTG